LVSVLIPRKAKIMVLIAPGKSNREIDCV